MEKIEEVRRQPEHIRMRYIFLCLCVSMLFIIGIWFLSLREGLSSARHGVPQALENSKAALPQEGVPSLNKLLEQASPLRVQNGKEVTGEEFFQGQVEEKNTSPQSEDVMPQ